VNDGTSVVVVEAVEVEVVEVEIAWLKKALGLRGRASRECELDGRQRVQKGCVDGSGGGCAWWKGSLGVSERASWLKIID
jgi:hypothetical protein